MAIRAIFFDIGDTLLFDDPPLRERFQIALRQAGIEYPEDGLAAAFRIGEEYAITQYREGLPFDDPQVMPETAKRILTALGVPALTDAQWQMLAEAFVGVGYTRRLHPQALPLVAELRGRGFRVGAISDWEETLPELLSDLDLAPYLDSLAVSAIVGVTKPDPRMFQEGLRQIGVAPEDALHVGDWYELDVCGARAVGMQAILFDHPRRRPDSDCPRVETFDQLAVLLLALPCPAC
jgi:HAD superfamily hydrolase (TIGR01549 family)